MFWVRRLHSEESPTGMCTQDMRFRNGEDISNSNIIERRCVMNRYTVQKTDLSCACKRCRCCEEVWEANTRTFCCSAKVSMYQNGSSARALVRVLFGLQNNA